MSHSKIKYAVSINSRASFIEFKIAHNGIPVTINLLPQIEEVGIDGTYRTPEKYEFTFTSLGLYTAQFNGYIMCKKSMEQLIQNLTILKSIRL